MSYVVLSKMKKLTNFFKIKSIKMRKLKIIIVLTSALIVTTLTAQDKQPIKEYGIGLSGLNNFSLQYRWGNENRLYRLSGNIGASTSFGKSDNNVTAGDTMRSGISTGNTKNTTPVNLNFGLGFSKLKLKFTTDKFGFMYGPSFGLNYNYSTFQSIGTGTNSGNYYYPYGTYSDDITSKYTSQSLQANIGFVVGAVYKINSSFLLYGEIIPSVFYSYTKSTTNRTNNNYNYDNRYYKENITNSNNSIGISNISNLYAMLTIVYRITK
jgi:hypothetical protein